MNDIHTERLVLRQLGTKDAPSVHAIVCHWSVVRQLGGWPWPADATQTERRCREAPTGTMAVLHRGRLIGTMGDANGEMGYMFAPEAHGRGFATEAAKAYIAALFKQTALSRITAKTWADNLASMRVLEKLGFRRTGGQTYNALARRTPVFSIHFELPRQGIR